MINGNCPTVTGYLVGFGIAKTPEAGCVQTVASLADDVLDELAINRTPRAREIVREAIRVARRSHAGPDDVAPAARQAGGDEVRIWARGTLRPRQVRLDAAGGHHCLRPGTPRSALLKR
jgi:hypothetical protein